MRSPSRILFEGRRAVGVAYRRGGAEQRATARREVILSGGPINSPQLLKLSGIGPADELRALGIDVVHDLPGVGENLQDHLEFYLQMECTPAGHALFGDEPAGQGGDRRALAADQGRAGRHQPFRELRLHPQPAGRPLSRHPVPLPAARGRL